MQEQLTLLKDVAARLESAGLVYMVSGSTALNFYAEPRMTRDVDLVVDLDAVNVDGFLSLLDPEEFYFDESAIRLAVQRRDMFNVIQLAHALKLDFVVRKASEYRELELSRRRRLDLDGTPIWVVAPEDLLLSKLHWARDSRSEVQLRDVRKLAAYATLDWSYVRRWGAELGLTESVDEVAP